jgi:3-isopropylmalate/(R)-2-methylmalate dehydratase large subunit
MTTDERRPTCTQSLDRGARLAYENPDQSTFELQKGRPHAPPGADWDAAVEGWRSLASDPGAPWDDVVTLEAEKIAPTVTWGINPGQSVAIDERLPQPDAAAVGDRAGLAEALQFMGFSAGQPVAGTKIDVAFIGSCTNGRLSDLREAARVAAGHKVAGHVRAIVVPGSQKVAVAAEREGLDEIFRAAGFEWRDAGCSMCLAMNPDRLEGREVCASSSNRNFKGRQGSPTGRTLLMSPAMVAAAAIAGEVVDIRTWARESVTA